MGGLPAHRVKEQRSRFALSASCFTKEAMCPDDYYMDGLSMDCIPLDTVKNPVEAPEEFEKLNGCNLGNNGVLFQKNNSNSQALSGTFKNSVIMKVETGNENHPNACTVKASAENHILEYKCGKEREFAGFPLPATELGTTVLVTAKTIQTSN
nr:TNFRSF13C isoform 2 [Scyliorhinus canicula]